MEETSEKKPNVDPSCTVLAPLCSILCSPYLSLWECAGTCDLSSGKHSHAGW